MKSQIYELESEVKRIKTELTNTELMYLKEVEAFTQEKFPDAGLILDEKFIDNLLSQDNKKSTDAQVTNPWFTKCYNIEWEKLFYYAMKLNKEFILSSKSCRDNLKTLEHYWGLL